MLKDASIAVIAAILNYLRHDVFVNLLFRLGPVHGDWLTPQVNTTRKQLTTRHRSRSVTLEFDESEAAILGFVGDARVDYGVDDPFHHRLHLVQYFLQRSRTSIISLNSPHICQVCSEHPHYGFSLYNIKFLLASVFFHQCKARYWYSNVVCLSSHSSEKLACGWS